MLQTLVLESPAHSLHHSILQLSRLMNQVEVLSTCLTNQPRIALVNVDVRRDIFPELLEDERTACEVQRGKAWVGDHLRDDLGWRTGDELDNTGWYTCLFKNLVNDVIGVGCCRRRFPDDSVANKGGCCATQR